LIDRTTAAAQAVPPQERWPWLFALCWVRAEQWEHDGQDPDVLAAALNDWRQLPEGVSGRARLAAVLVNAQLRAGGVTTPAGADRLEALAVVAGTDSAPHPQWPADRAAVRALWLMVALQHGHAGVDARAALAEIDGLASTVGAAQPHATMIQSARVIALHVRSRDDGDLRGQEEVLEEVERLRSTVPPGSTQDVRARIIAAMQAAQTAVGRGDVAAAAEQVDRVVGLRRELPADDRLGVQIDEMAGSFQSMRGMLGDVTSGSPTSSARFADLRRLADQPGLLAAEQAMYLAELGIMELGAGGSYLDLAVDDLRLAVQVAPGTDSRRVFYTTSCAGALIRRYEERRSRPDVREAVRLLEGARDELGGPAHPQWAMTGQMLGHAYRLSGRQPLGRETGRDALRGHTMSVLLQTGTGNATAAARDAASDAIDVARWCLSDSDVEGAAAALDAGRGLMLQAAVTLTGVPERLIGLGERELARRWGDATRSGGADAAPTELRREIVTRLAGEPGTIADPPPAHEVRAALSALSADALVYLVPGDDGVGAAVVVPARDAPTWLPLPQLTVGTSTVVERHLADAFTRDAPFRDFLVDEPPRSKWTGTLEEVCAWAWPAAIGPLLDQHLPLHHGLSGTPRLVLVPMGALARVPWHAAYTTEQGRRRYAVQRAVLSYAVSARMLCDSAWADAVPLTRSGLVIGDPDTGHRAADLRGARAEAIALRQEFYPQARYLGRDAKGRRDPGGAGTRADVQGWLAEDANFAGPLLHAACHAVMRTGADDTSYLMLAGGDTLSAEELIRGLTAQRGRPLALAVLAACSSGVPGRGYDEAFSLATAFLTGGARSVVSALWKVPDSATSALMFLFHHFLRASPPREALREAQLWMLDPNREPPATMPAQLRNRLAGTDPADIAAWAGFTHTGR